MMRYCSGFSGVVSTKKKEVLLLFSCFSLRLFRPDKDDDEDEDSSEGVLTDGVD